MKKYLLIAVLMICSFATQAQTASSSAPIDPLLKGKDLMEQLVAALDASTFLNSWTSEQRAQWKSELSQASDAVALSKSASYLSEYIKPGKYKEQFSLAQLKALAAGTKNYGDVANVLATLESGLATEAFSNGWISQEASWLSELSLVK
ncbi:MAG: hypothetical protein K0R51_1490 [Cytophagaceae bacterium]|jgi:hypothetical protein|nr:hypothetical protein [Cytophagaceae bacterium]